MAKRTSSVVKSHKTLIRRLTKLDLKSWGGLIPLIVFLLTVIPAGTYLVFNVPFLWAADGGAHVSRVFQIAEDGITPTFIDHNHGVGYGGKIPANLNDLKNLEGNLVGLSPVAPGQETPKKLITAQAKADVAKITSQKISKAKVLVSFVNSAAYSPIAYAPNVLGVIAGINLNLSLGHTLLLAQLCGFAAFVVCGGYALFTLRKSQLKWAVMTVALLPLVVFQTTVITADSFLFTISILFSALIIKALSASLKLTTLDKVLLFACILMLPLIKSVYFPLVFIVLLLPKRHWKNPRNYWIWTGSALMISMVAFGIWSHLTTDVAASNGLVRGDTIWKYGDANRQKNFIIGHPLGYIHVLVDSILYGSKFYMDTFFGWLGFTYLPIPGIAEISGYLALGLSLLLAGKVRLRKYISGTILLILGSVALIIFTTLYVYFTPVMNNLVQGVQGRYFLPLTILLITGAAAFFPKLRIESDGVDTAKFILVILITFCCLFSILRYGLAITA